MVYFTLDSAIEKSSKKIENKSNLIKTNLVGSYLNFKNHLNAYEKLIKNYLDKKKNFYVIGAGLMLPLLNYHMNGLINKANAILDDDNHKIGKYFANINTRILSLREADLKNSICLIAPVASAIITRRLVSILNNKHAEIILVPTLTF